MGRPKAALPLADRADTFVHRLARTFLAAGVPDVIVVSGAHDADVRRALGPADGRVRVLHNHRWPDGQLTSLQAALSAPSRTGRTADLEAFVMTLVDIPLIAAATVAAIVAAWRRTRAPIVRPARGAVHGHPVLFDRALFDELLAADPQVGAKAVVRAHAHEIVNLTLADDGAFADVDTEEDYASLRRGLQSTVNG